MSEASEKPRNTKRNPDCASIFDLELPNGRRLGDASVADLEAAIGPYAEQGDNKARTMRELVKMAHRFARAGY